MTQNRALFGIALWRKLMRHFGVPLVAVLAAAAVAQTSWLQSLENVYYDYWHVIAGVRYVPTHAAVVSAALGVPCP